MRLNHLNLNTKIFAKKLIQNVEKTKERPNEIEKQKPARTERQNQDIASVKMLEDYIQNYEEYVSSTLFSEEENEQESSKILINPNISSPLEFPQSSGAVISYLKGELPMEKYFDMLQTPGFKYDYKSVDDCTERAILVILEAAGVKDSDSLEEKINKVIALYEKMGSKKMGNLTPDDLIKDEYKNNQILDDDTIYNYILKNGFIHEIEYTLEDVKNDLRNRLEFRHYDGTGNVVVDYDYTSYLDSILDEYIDKYYDVVEKDGRTIYLSKDKVDARYAGIHQNGNEIYLGYMEYDKRDKNIVLGEIKNDEVVTEAEKIREQIINLGISPLNVDSQWNSDNLLREPKESDFNTYLVEELIQEDERVYSHKYYKEPLNINGTYKDGLYSDGNRTFIWTGQNFIEIPNDLLDEKGRITEKYVNTEYAYKNINGIAGYEELLTVIRGGYSMVELSSQRISGHILYTKGGNIYYYDKQSHSMSIIPDLKVK